MQLLDLTLDTAAENLALDEALLERAEQSRQPAEVLRLWEPRSTMVVVGSSSRAADEVKLDECRRRGVPVLRRASGGATIVAGPGCFMYGVVLSYDLRPELRAIDRAHRFVLDRIAGALRSDSNKSIQSSTSELNPSQCDSDAAGIHCAGTSDLAIGEQKFSGNSMRCKRTHLLYHGTLLYAFPLEQVEELLTMPSRQPAYRAGRRHREFLTNVPLPAVTLRQALIDAFHTDAILPDWPRELTQQLVAQKYSQDQWNYRL